MSDPGDQGPFDLSAYRYHLPQELIAQHPCSRRDSCRLMVVDRGRRVVLHERFNRLPRFLPPKTLMVLNNSRVMPARLLGHKVRTRGQCEVFLLKAVEGRNVFEALLRPLKKMQQGEVMDFGHGLQATLMDKDKRIVRFNKANVVPYLNRYGHMPLPPYITREDQARDRRSYQTVYAKTPGSVAAPTAGLHFTKSLLSRLKEAGHSLRELTLHVNYGTFKPVECADIRQHPMHEEFYTVPASLDMGVRRAQASGRKVLAVGTTSCRVLESVAAGGPLQGSTRIFMYPGFQFRATDMLITNFHLPESTLLMLMCAFGGYQLIMEAYRQAIQERYRFYSYGDAMLIL